MTRIRLQFQGTDDRWRFTARRKDPKTEAEAQQMVDRLARRGLRYRFVMDEGTDLWARPTRKGGK